MKRKSYLKKENPVFKEELHENKYFSDCVTVYQKRKTFEEKGKTCIKRMVRSKIS